jgi:hypothetical protein
VSEVGEFEELRPLLFSIAYRILGSLGDAEDAVQETWLRFAGSATRPASAKAFLSAVVTRISIDVTFEPHENNGRPGAIFRDRDGRVLHTLALDVLDGRIQTIRSVINPDKLGHVGPVADAWAIAREVRRARRAAE